MSFRRDSLLGGGGGGYGDTGSHRNVEEVDASTRIENARSHLDWNTVGTALGGAALGFALGNGIAGAFNIWPEAITGIAGGGLIVREVVRDVRDASRSYQP